MDIIELLKVVFIGIVQGITEWLPVSSTGHMILVDEFIRLNVTKEFWDMFLVVIQFGSILAVVVLFFNKLNPFTRRKSTLEKYQTIDLWLKVLVAIIPAGVIGLLFGDIIDDMFFNYKTVTVTLILYGIFFIVIENYNKKRRPAVKSFEELSYKRAFLIGCCQVLSLIPGTSRSGSTILGGILLGTSRFVAAEFSFFLAIPVMFGASCVKLLKFGFNFTGNELMLLLTGMVVAFVVSIAAIKFLLGYIKKHDFKAFGYYRIALGIIVMLYFLIIG